jgi:hypothetical protein
MPNAANVLPATNVPNAVWFPATLQHFTSSGFENFTNLRADALLRFYGLTAVGGNNMLRLKRQAIAAHIGVRIQF